MRRHAALLALPILALAPVRLPAQTGGPSEGPAVLAAFAALPGTDAGKAALASNFAVTAAIHDGSAQQPLLEPFPAARGRALRDATITSENGTQLADGLGSALGAAYQAMAPCTSANDGATVTCTKAPASVADLLEAVAGQSAADSAAAKSHFGAVDVYGTAYGLPAGTAGADAKGDSRPFQTEPSYADFTAPDYFGIAHSSRDYLTGPVQDLVMSPSFPSGHTTYGYTESILLGLLVPARYPQMVVRAAEYGNGRIVIGAHYAMDVIGGRTLALYDLAHYLAGANGDPERSALLGRARGDLAAALEGRCGAALAACAASDRSRFADGAADASFYESTQTYGLAPVRPGAVSQREDVSRIARDAGYLLTVAFPNLSLERADALLTQTEGPGGGFLDDGSEYGVYSRLDLYRAALAAGKRRSD